MSRVTLSYPVLQITAFGLIYEKPSGPTDIDPAVPVLLAAVIFAWPLVFPDHYVLGTDRLSLTKVMQIEWLLMAGGLFLVLPLLGNSIMRWNARLSLVLFIGFAWTFAYGAYDLDGTRGLASYVVLLFLSYGGNTLFVRKDCFREIMGLIAAARWFISLFAFFPLVVYFDLGKGDIKNWGGKLAVVEMGAWFFFILFLLELFVFSWMTQLLYRHAQAKHDRAEIQHGGMAARRRFYDAAKRAARTPTGRSSR